MNQGIPPTILTQNPGNNGLPIISNGAVVNVPLADTVKHVQAMAPLRTYHVATVCYIFVIIKCTCIMVDLYR